MVVASCANTQKRTDTVMIINRIIATSDTIRILADAPIPADAEVKVIPFSPIQAEEV